MKKSLVLFAFIMMIICAGSLFTVVFTMDQLMFATTMFASWAVTFTLLVKS